MKKWGRVGLLTIPALRVQMAVKVREGHSGGTASLGGIVETT